MSCHRRWLLLCSPLLLLSLASCSTSKSTPTAPSADVTAPFVVSIDPGIDDTGVAVDATITVVFNEAMNPATSAGNVTISSGTITNMTWSDARTLVITHSGWAEGVEVTVTLAAGLTDAAGNALEALFAANFWTLSSVVQLLSSTPSDGLTNVLRNPQVMMLFSHDMNMASLNTAVTVTNVTAGGSVAFNLTQGEDTWIAMSFPTTLPASTQIRVDVSTAAQSMGGTNLAAAASFSFTTGAEIDTEAPTLVSIEPPNGSVISASTGSIRMTFSEALDPNAFSPSTMSAQLWMLMEEAGVEPVWSEGNSVLTVALPTPLPAGLPMVVSFETYQDPAGNVQTTPLNYAVTVAGTPSYFPLIDGTVHEFMESWTEVGTTRPEASGSGPSWVRTEQDAANDFRIVRYPSADLVGSDNWEFYRRNAATIDFLGFHENSGGDVLFDSPVLYAKIPWQVQSWSGSVQATTGEGTLDIAYTISVLLQEDVAAPAGSEDVTLLWKNCWKAELEYQLSAGGESQGSGTETMWFAPTVGIVQRSSVEDEPGGYHRTSDEYLVMQ